MPRRPTSEPTLDTLLAMVESKNNLFEATVAHAKQELQAAVDDARALGASWAQIAEACGLAGRSSAQARFTADNESKEAAAKRVKAYQKRLREARDRDQH